MFDEGSFPDDRHGPRATRAVKAYAYVLGAQPRQLAMVVLCYFGHT
jgi:hypothetical protein